MIRALPFFLIFSLLFLASCQKNTYELGMAEEEKRDAPEYTVEANLNGGVTKLEKQK